ncbi:MAG TPA: nucleotidyltransferase family protein [Gaiellales bacterium]
MIAAVVLGAGAGSRYGGLKQLHPVDGRPMLERVLQTVAEAGLEQRVVVLGARAGTILERIDLYDAQPVVCDRWDAGQAASLHAGLAALPAEAGSALVVLGDGPNLDRRAIARVIAAGEQDVDSILAADYGQGRSHPVLIPRARFGDIPTSGERPVRGLPAATVDCADLTPPGDVDYA